MSDPKLPIFHIAFPIKDVKATESFYSDELGLKVVLSENKRLIIDFFGHQAVAHVSENDIPERVSMYPRHFGIILESLEQFQSFYEKVQSAQVEFFQDLMTRFENTPREHKTFFIKDPSNNLLEFKWYKEHDYILRNDQNTPSLEEWSKDRS